MWFTIMTTVLKSSLLPTTFPGIERIYRAVCLSRAAPPLIYLQGFKLISSWSDIFNKWSDFAALCSLKCISLCCWMCVGVFKLSVISLSQQTKRHVCSWYNETGWIHDPVWADNIVFGFAHMLVSLPIRMPDYSWSETAENYRELYM